MERTMESMKTLKKSTISVSQNCRQPQQQQQRRRRGRGRRHHFTTRKSSKFYDENRKYKINKSEKINHLFLFFSQFFIFIHVLLIVIHNTGEKYHSQMNRI
mgnify:CR=1 FL=1